ncbi:MAG: T9SS type A sorting domain-containing protein [Desulfovibrionales bacterium]|nr:T9SS type A sorting domain-containing protein [Desulfovibrionales bacterium]
MADINALETKSWNEGKGFSPIKDFKGTFNGNGYLIKDIYINRPKERMIGFFGWLLEGANVTALGLVDIEVTGERQVGGIVGYTQGARITRCYSTGTINGENTVGGLLGEMESETVLENSFTVTSLTAQYYIGGLVGAISKHDGRSSTILNCYAISKPTQSSVRGLIGSDYNDYHVSLMGCFWDNTINKNENSTDQRLSKSTAQFSNLKNFLGWSSSAWEVVTKKHIDPYPRPYLDWQLNDQVIYVNQEPRGALKMVTGKTKGKIGERLTFQAHPLPGYTFLKWVGSNGEDLGRQPMLDWTVEEAGTKHVIAHFEPVAYQFKGGTGIISKPYHIRSMDDLAYLSANPIHWEDHFVLVNDIDASETEKWFSGKGFKPIQKFTGSMKGNGYTITNLHISRANESNVGLFGNYEGRGLSDLHLENASIVGLDKVGTLAGTALRSIKDCTVRHSRVLGRDKVGGVAGIADYSIKNCQVQAEVIGNNNVGGLVGWTFGGLYECLFTGKVHGEEAVGGATGTLKNAQIKWTGVHGEIKANKYVGGLTGHIYMTHSFYQDSVVRYSYACAFVQGEEYTGALIGSMYKGSVGASYWDKDVSGVQTSVGSDPRMGLTSAQFASKESFPEWNFENSWEIATKEEWSNSPRPYLKKHLYDLVVEIQSKPEQAMDSSEGQGAYTFTEGEEQFITLVAKPKKGYRFAKWMVDGKDLSQEISYTIPLNKSTPRLIRAHFVEDYSFAGGDGTKENPFQIETIEHLGILSNIRSIWDKHFVLTADIDATETVNWEMGKGMSPIGIGHIPDASFTGSFIGNFHTITNLTINRESEDYVGLFGITFDAQISQLVLNNCQVNGNEHVGGLIGFAGEGTFLQDLVISGNVTGEQHVGLLSGTSYGKVAYVMGYGTVAATQELGGLVGNNYIFPLQQSFAVVKLTGEEKVGGLVGQSHLSGIQFDSYWDKTYAGVSVSAEGKGIDSDSFSNEKAFTEWDFNNVWEMYKWDEWDGKLRPILKRKIYPYSLIIEGYPVSAMANSTEGGAYVIGDQVSITAVAQPGYRFKKWAIDGQEVTQEATYTFTVQENSPERLIAHFELDYEFAGGDGTFGNPYQIKTLEQLAYLSYIPELDRKSFILLKDIDATETKDWNQGKGFSPIGNEQAPFSGWFNGNGHTISNLFIFRPYSNTVGLFGQIDSGELKGIILKNATIHGYDKAGALAGFSDVAVKHCGVSGKVVGHDLIGGLIGVQVGDVTDVEQCYSHAQVKGNRTVGGLIGSNGSIVTETYATGKVEGNSNVGGLLGYNNEYVYESYAIGQVKGESRSGGLIGSNWIQWDEYRSYWDKETTGQSHSSGSKDHKGLVSSDFSSLNHFVGWSWSNWEIRTRREISQFPRPYLRFEELKQVTVKSSDYRLGEIENWDENSVMEVGRSINLKAVPNYPFGIFMGWEVNGEYYGEENPINLTVDDHLHIRAIFYDQDEVLSVGLSEEIWVNPNPAQAQLEVHGLKSGDSILILSLVGKVMKTKQVTSTSFILDVSSFPRGIYLLRVNQNKVRKIILQ